MRKQWLGLAVASVFLITGCAAGADGTYGGFQVTHTPAPGTQTATLPPQPPPQLPPQAPPPAIYENAPEYYGQGPSYQQQPGFSSSLACGINGGDFVFFGDKNRKYQPISFAVAPGETQQIQVVQDDSRRRDRIYVQGDLSGVGVRITRNRPAAPGSGLSTFGASGAFVSSEPLLVKGVSEPLNINDMFRGATITCGFRSPPGVLPGRRPYYRGY